MGLVVEQHPDRAALFMQWHEMDWPVLWDPLNLLELKAVPHTLLIDERGTVVAIKPTAEDLETFLGREAEEAGPPRQAEKPDLAALRVSLDPGRDPRRARQLADALVLWGTDAELDEAIRLYKTGFARPELAPVNHFRTGVAFRRRYDSPHRRDGDFATAVEHWSRALALDPDQYIWRRRIQQYGPTLDKPYPFYNWVDEARLAIRQRGETPVRLAVEPRGAELASPTRRFVPAPQTGPPDSERRLAEDLEPLVVLEATVVPGTQTADTPSWAVHLEFRPDPARQAHWNNEADPLLVWLDPSDEYDVDRRLLRHRPPPAAVSDEPRRFEFQVQQRAAGEAVVTGRVLYGICTDDDGTCRFLRREFRIPLVR